VLEGLRAQSDRDHHLVLLGAPHFLFADGHLLWQSPLRRLQQPISQLLSPDVPAAMLSLHLQPYFFGELRLAGRPEQDAFHLGQLLQEQIAILPDQVRAYLVTHSHPYWQELASAFPEMLIYLKQQSRVAVEGDQAVLTFALPTAAAHNLFLAAELALATPASTAAPVDARQPGPRELEEWLTVRVNLAFPQLSLEAALEELQTVAAQQAPAATMPLRIRILGEDLKLAGITRNQQIRDLQLAQTTVAEALTEIVRRGNPIAGGEVLLRSTEQKLVWVVATPPGQDQPAIVITTRTAAQDRSWQLPSPFLSP
jgi:hypothetical protein